MSITTIQMISHHKKCGTKENKKIYMHVHAPDRIYWSIKEQISTYVGWDNLK